VPFLPLTPPLATIPLPLRLITAFRPMVALPRTHYCYREGLCLACFMCVDTLVLCRPPDILVDASRHCPRRRRRSQSSAIRPLPVSSRNRYFLASSAHTPGSESGDEDPRLHDREDTWVILAHEYEVEKVVPEDIDLSDWQNKGWKDKVAEERASASKLSCYA
jgi:hypothetical protein